MTDYYKVHDLFSVTVSSSAAHIREGYKHYFRYFQTEQAPSKGRVYHVRDFFEFRLPTVWRKDGPYTGFSSGFLIPKEKYVVVIHEGGVEEYTTYANRATNLWVQTLLVSQGVSLVHGAGMSIGGKGLLFAGFGGVGKTLLVSELVKQSNAMFFGDDYVVITAQGKMYSYPSDFSIYPYHRAVFPRLKKTPYARYLTRRRIFSPYYETKRVINFFSRRFTKIGAPILRGWDASYTKVPATFLIPKEKIAESENLYACVVLTRHDIAETILEEMDTGTCVALLMGNLQIELMHALPYLYALNAFSAFDVAHFFSKMQFTIRQCMSSIKKFRLLIPLRIHTPMIASTIIEKLKHIL